MPDPTWRDETPVAVQADIDALAAAAFAAAEQLLGLHRDFEPFAVGIDDTGGVVRPTFDQGSAPDQLALLEGVKASVRAGRRAYRAVAFVALVFTRTGDAVRVELEHRDGGPALVLLASCRVGRLVRRVTMGPVGGSVGCHLVWTDEGAAGA